MVLVGAPEKKWLGGVFGCYAAHSDSLFSLLSCPPLYTYVRFEVRAPTLTLPHHQHLLGKNLCLMPRATEHWDMSKSVAWYLDTQLPKVIAAGAATDTSDAAALEEEEQAEPITDYFVY